MKTQFPIALNANSILPPKYGVQFKEYGDQVSACQLLGSDLQAAYGGTGTALRSSQFSPLTETYCLPIYTRTETQARAGQFPEEKIIGQLNRGFSKVMPLVSLTALIACSSYSFEPAGSMLAPTWTWVDRSSEATWVPVNEAGMLQAATVGTSLELHAASLEHRDNSAEAAVAAIEEQPRFDYREVLAYARDMGLPTEFPL